MEFHSLLHLFYVPCSVFSYLYFDFTPLYQKRHWKSLLLAYACECWSHSFCSCLLLFHFNIICFSIKSSIYPHILKIARLCPFYIIISKLLATVDGNFMQLFTMSAYIVTFILLQWANGNVLVNCNVFSYIHLTSWLHWT